MESKLGVSLKLKFQPVAVSWTDLLPEGARQFARGKWGCVMMLFAAAAKGKTVAFDRETCGCMGGSVGLGFGNTYTQWAGGIECFYRFLSSGSADLEKSREIIEKMGVHMTPERLDNFINGERYLKSPELAKKFVENLPMIDAPEKYVVMRPLKDADLAREKPQVIVFVANPDQISALSVMANYGRMNPENVMTPFGAGCHQIGIIPLNEAKREFPRAVLGLTDLSARNAVKNTLGRDILTFSVPLKMFLEMEENEEGSFLHRHTWKELMKDK